MPQWDNIALELLSEADRWNWLEKQLFRPECIIEPSTISNTTAQFAFHIITKGVPGFRYEWRTRRTSGNNQRWSAWSGVLVPDSATQPTNRNLQTIQGLNNNRAYAIQGRVSNRFGVGPIYELQFSTR